MSDEDTLRCDDCGSLYHRTYNCPKTAPRYIVREQTIGEDEVYGVIDRRTGTLVSGSLTYQEGEAETTAIRLNKEKP